MSKTKAKPPARSEPPVEAGDLAPEVLERLITSGDLSALSPQQRVAYYIHRCRQVGLDPAAQPFQYLRLNGRLVLYATKAATDQLSGVHKLSTRIVSREMIDGMYVVTARVEGPDGRVTEEIGAVSLSGLRGDARANAVMKAHTKAKRRAILAHLGLGMLDESEVETIPGARRVAIGEAQEAPPSTRVESDAPPSEPESDNSTGKDAPDPKELISQIRQLLGCMSNPHQDPVVVGIFQRHGVDLRRGRERYTIDGLRAVLTELDEYVIGREAE